MNRILTLAFCMAAASASATAAVDVAELARYVYPANAAASASLRYMPDGLTYVKTGEGARTIEQYDVATGKHAGTILNTATTRGDSKIESVGGFKVSADGTKLLVYQTATPIYRNSFKAAWYIYDIKRNTLKPLSREHAMQQEPLFSPDGRMVAFMADDNNIYIHKVDYGSEVAVTTDGEPGRIINGVPDWVYQEELYTGRSMEFAPDNSGLSYLRYDEEQVPAYSLTLYQGACGPTDAYALYPGRFTYKYPVAGEPNSKVTLHCYDVETRKTKNIDLDMEDVEYIPSIHYGDSASRLIVTALNRDQNRLDILSVNPRSTVVTPIHRETSTAWIEPQCYAKIAYEPTSMVIFSDRTGYSHLYRLDYNGNPVATLTSGAYDVTEYYGTAADGTYYYQSAEPNPMSRVVTRVDRKGKRSTVGEASGWNSATFAPGMAYCTLTHSSATEPPVYTLYSTGKGKSVRTLEDNAGYAARFAEAPKKEFFTMTNDGVTLNGWIIKPAGFDPSKKYPAIISQYSGPGSQEVTDNWRMDWAQYFATQGYVIACVDGRGTGGRGREFEQIVYRNLGHYETLDQTALLNHLRAQSWIAADRVGIYGWSFGGYESLMAASSGAPFAAAVAVAPVTSWRLYDTIYTERYMSTPRQNAEGYDRSAPLERVAGLKCPLLLMYGTSDDNVHPENSIELTARMIHEDKWPEVLMFPGMNHSIYGCNTRALVYSRMLDFFNRTLIGR